MVESDVEERILALLQAGNIEQAVAEWGEWDWVSPSSVGRWQGIDNRKPENYAGNIDLVRRVLAKRHDAVGLKLAADLLFGRGMHTPDRNVVTAARFESEVHAAKETPFVVGMALIEGSHGCKAAKDLCGCYRLADVPLFPPKNCDNEFGCCCYWEVIFDDETPSTSWRS